ncbi:MAG: hypothetical protein NTY09_07215 [bacterium]|nr:hypothetical protein [bacterium]
MSRDTGKIITGEERTQPQGNIPPEPKGLRRRLRWIFILTFVAYLIPAPIGIGHFLLTKSRADSWNDEARIATVESLVEQKTMAIEYTKWGWFTGDKVLLREHFYATKPPLLSAVGAVSYAAFRGVVKATTGQLLTYRKNEDIIYPYVTLTTSVLSLALLLTYFYRALYLVNITDKARWWLFWALAIGSLYPAYSTVFNNHTVAGAGIFISFYYILRYRLGGPLKWWEALLAGLSIGFAGVTDFTGALPFLVFFFILLLIHDFRSISLPSNILKPQEGSIALGISFALAAAFLSIFLIGERGIAILFFGPLIVSILICLFLLSRRKPGSILFLIGILIPVAAHLFLNSRITGNWLPTYIQSDVYIATPPGYFGEVLRPDESGFLNWDRWIYVGTGLFGIRGIFLYTPALLIGLICATAIALKRNNPMRLDAIALVLSVVAGWGYVLLFASANFGGTSYGFRYALAATPLLIFFCHKIFTDWEKIGAPVFRNAVAWGAIVGLIAIPYPWGMFGQLPATLCSIVGNLEYIALTLMYGLS